MATTTKFSRIANSALPFTEDFEVHWKVSTCKTKSEAIKDGWSEELSNLDHDVSETFETLLLPASSLWGWMMGSRVPEVVEEECREIQVLADTGDSLPGEGMVDTLDNEGKVVRRRPRQDNSIWWVPYAVVAQGKFFEPSNTVAMRRTIHKFIYDNMREDHVTTVDIARVIPLAVEWTYLPNAPDIKAAQYRASRVAYEREVEAAKNWWSVWWGSRVSPIATT